MNKQLALLSALTLLVSACADMAGTDTSVSSSGSSSTLAPLIPDGGIPITSSLELSYLKLGSAALVIGAIYLIYDPMAPNWSIKEQKLANDTFRFDMKMKRYHTGGEGEAMQVLRRRASKLQRDLGYQEYQLVEFSEGIESKTLGANRYAEATIKLLKPVKKTG